MTETSSGPDRSPAPVAAGYGMVIASWTTLDRPWTEFGRFIRTVEDAGCDAIWLTDHLFSGYPSAEALVLAGVAATHTSHCTIGTGVLQLPLRSTAAVAKAAGTIQMLSGQRFVLGVGVGQHRREFERSGVDFSRRGRDLDEAIVKLADCWRTDDWFSQRPAVAPIPVWGGGHSVAAIRRAARHLDGWMPIFLSPKRYIDSNRMLDECLTDLGRNPDDVARAVTLIVGVTGASWSHGEAISMAGELFPTGEAGLDRYVITGPVDECVERVTEFESNGATSVAIFPVRRDFAPMFAELRIALLENRASRTLTTPA